MTARGVAHGVGRGWSRVGAFAVTRGVEIRTGRGAGPWIERARAWGATVVRWRPVHEPGPWTERRWSHEGGPWIEDVGSTKAG